MMLIADAATVADAVGDAGDCLAAVLSLLLSRDCTGKVVLLLWLLLLSHGRCGGGETEVEDDDEMIAELLLVSAGSRSRVVTRRADTKTSTLLWVSAMINDQKEPY